MSKKTLRLKLGPIEIEIEGDELPTMSDLRELAAAAAAIYRERELDMPKDEATAEFRKIRIQGSTASIASRLNCVSAPELIIAAAARITFVKGEEWFDANQLLEEMKTATAHFEGSYQPAIKTDIEVLVDNGKLVEVAPQLFALSATMRRELQRALAE